MMQCVAGAAGAMFLVCLIFIPNPLCSLWVTFSIVSIMSGVMGFMSLLGVDLDIITISFVVVCIGLSGLTCQTHDFKFNVIFKNVVALGNVNLLFS